MHQFRAKDSEIKPYFKSSTIGNMKKTEKKESVKVFLLIKILLILTIF